MPDASKPDGATECLPGCDGQILTLCSGSSGPVTTDCSTKKDSSGRALACQFIADQETYGCAADLGGGCGDETFEGRCEGTKLIRCGSSEGTDHADGGAPQSAIDTVDCASDPDGYTTCAVAPDGTAGCAAPGTAGCGSVPVVGQCEGNTSTRCVGSAIETVDCQSKTQKCGLQSDDASYGCVDAALYVTSTAGDPATAVSGTLVFEKKTVDTSSFEAASKGFGATPVLTPVRRALVRLVGEDDTELQRTFTDDDGAFTLHLPSASTSAYVTVSASADPTSQALTIRDCPPSKSEPPEYPDGCTDEIGKAYTWKSDAFTGGTALGQKTVTEASGLAGAFNVFDLLLKGQDFARVNLNHGDFPSTPPLVAEWKKGFETSTSFFNGTGVVIQGLEDDTDEFDDPVLMHEFGHFLQARFSKSDSPGGDHDGTPTDPTLAFGEGYGTYVGCRISGSSLYYDTSASGTSVTDLNNTGVKATLDDPLGIEQLLSEYMVGEILWRIDVGSGGDQAGSGASGGQGSAPVFDVLGDYFKGNDKYKEGHGVEGRELVKFLDGWFCRDFGAKATASTPVLKGVVTTDHDFPYDDYEHAISPIGSCK